MTDKSEKAIDALHTELSVDQRATANMLQKSTEGNTEDAPPMPDDLLNDVLSDLGVEKSTPSQPTIEKKGLLDRWLEVFSGKPVALAGLAAAACVVAIIAMNLGDDNEPGGVRGGGAQVIEPPIVIFIDPTPEQEAAAQENFESEHLQFSAGTDSIAIDSARILISGGKVQAFNSGEEQTFMEVDAPADPLELIDTITELTQQFEIAE